MRDFVKTARNILVLLEPGTKTKWVVLILLAVFVSALELVAAILIFVLLGTMAAPGAEIGVPLVGNVEEIVPGLSDSNRLVPILAVVAAFFLLRGTVYLLQSYLQNRLSYATGSRLGRRLLRGYLAMDYSTYLQRNSAELIRNAHESTLALASYVLLPGIVLAAELFVTLTLCSVLLVTSPLAAGGAFLFLGGLVLVILRVVQPRLLRAGRLVQDMTTASLHSLQQTLLGFRDIRVLGRERFFEDEFAKSRQRLADTYAVRGVLIDTPRVALETSVLLVLLIFVGLNAARGDSLDESTTILGLFGYAAFRILPSVNRIVNNLQSLKFAAPVVADLCQEVIAAESERSPEPEVTEPTSFEVLELRDVAYRYPGADREAVSGLNLRIERGQSVGFVGATGSGKSTILDLMLGLLEPSSGSVRVNGEPLPASPRKWHRLLGVVPQTIFLLDDTIRENVALGVGRKVADDERVQEALQIAQLQSFVEASPLGLDTMIGERGVRLSGGQRQRLAIARAMYRRPEVLIFDEGTSALDNRTESEVTNALRRLRREVTLITVAHRLTTIKECDVVLLIIDGRIAALGKFDELLRTSEEFRKLASMGAAEVP